MWKEEEELGAIDLKKKGNVDAPSCAGRAGSSGCRVRSVGAHSPMGIKGKSTAHASRGPGDIGPGKGGVRPTLNAGVGRQGE